jgi:pantetheine-phosphate adenylyltransferase
MRNNIMTSKKIGVYPGTFDPFTLGHADILRRALNLFDEIVILVGVHPEKRSLFSSDERLEMLRELYQNEPRVRIDCWNGLLVEYTRKNKIQGIVRGLRPTGDFESEYRMASMNHKLDSFVETIFLMTSGDYNYISSSLIKEIFDHDGDVSQFVPPVINKKLISKKS